MSGGGLADWEPTVVLSPCHQVRENILYYRHGGPYLEVEEDKASAQYIWVNPHEMRIL